jgi:palmitoyl-protein thioesterase
VLHKYTINNLFLFTLTTLCFTSIIAKNLPIVLVHGILSDKHAMLPAKKNIKKYLPGVYVKSINLGEGKITSLFNMHDQVNWLKQELEADEQLRNGCIMIGHSQGGLVARYFVEKYNNPHIYVYISWGSPESGIFGSPGSIDQRFAWLKLMESYTYKFAYSYLMQRFVSFASYWKDPLHYETYLQKNVFLPYINNELDHDDAELFKQNICSLATMVLVQSTREDVVDPAASCHFGFYQPGNLNTIQPVFDSEWYHADKLGLKTLAESGRLHLKFAHCAHSEFQADEYNFIHNTLPYLTYEAPTT